MSSNPYENEPGFEDSDDKEAEKAYAAKIFHETIRVSIIERMEDYLGLKMLRLPDPTKDRMMILKEMWKPDESSEGRFEPFRDMCKLRFLWYYDSYLLTIDREAKLHPDGKKFPSMDFENVGNSMDGTYQYSQLRRRLELVKKAMDEELTQWTAEGQLCVQKELPFAAQLVQMQEQVIELYKQKGDVALHIELENDNPFVWNLVLLGRPMTNLEGGIIKIRMHISPRFPQEQPRVQVVTPLFHHRVAEQGQLCYLLRGSSDDLRMHIESIITAISDPDPPYDPRTLVNPVASKLYWGSEEDKRLYNRKLRRSVQESAE
jgi:ubiquitin-conjugating enzyme E2 Z